MNPLRISQWIVLSALLLSLGTGCPKEEPPPPDVGGAGGTAGMADGSEGGIAGDPGSLSNEPVTVAQPAGERLERVYFEFDSSTLSPESRQMLQANYDILRRAPSVRVEIEGHTDERGTNEYNLALGWRRARAVRDYLISLGIDSARLDTISYGEELPVDAGSNESAWAKNRRAQFRVIN